MGRQAREQPKRLAEKLRQIRHALGLSQSEMLRQLGMEEKGHRNFISDYERGMRVPSLLEVLAYSRVARISMDLLIDDNLELPKRISTK
jgi:transcriptional regulator with XRE-family HTH domain